MIFDIFVRFVDSEKSKILRNFTFFEISLDAPRSFPGAFGMRGDLGAREGAMELLGRSRCYARGLGGDVEREREKERERTIERDSDQ